MRKFVARLFGLQVPPVEPQKVNRLAPPADPLQRAYRDAFYLTSRIYRGQPWSRRAMSGEMTQARWQAATRMLKRVGILDYRTRFVPSVAETHEEAIHLLTEFRYGEERRQRNPRYVSPW